MLKQLLSMVLPQMHKKYADKFDKFMRRRPLPARDYVA